MQQPFTDTDVRLQRLTLEDAAPLYALIDRSRDNFRTWLTWVDGTRTVEQVSDSIKVSLKKDAHRYGIYFKRELVGTINFHGGSDQNRSDSIGYWLDQNYQGKGIMTKATFALLKIGFHALQLNSVRIHCATGNTASRAVAERLGFKLEGVLRQDVWLQNQFVDSAIYGMLATEFQSRFFSEDNDQ